MQTPNTPSANPVTQSDRITYWLSRHWLLVCNTAVGLYVFIPMLLAPTLMKIGLEGAGRFVYTIYSPMCHQMASRSFFLYGEQYAYPVALANTNLTPLEAYSPNLDQFDGTDSTQWTSYFMAARRFVGNEQMGYKMALCERDIAIYGFVFLGGLLFGLLRSRFNIRPLPFLLFLIIGMGPIAWDGFSQLFGYYTLPLDGGDPAPFQEALATLFAARESPPWLRFSTGALFGFMLAWLAYPQVEQGMKASEQQALARINRAQSNNQPN